MSRGIPRIAPQRHVFVRAEQRANIAAKKGLTVRTDKNFRAPKVKGIKTRRPGDIEETKIHSWQVPGGVLKLILVRFIDHKRANEDWSTGRNIDAILMNGVRVRQLRWKSADTNYDAQVVGGQNVTKTPSSTFTFLAQKYELFYRHNPLYGPNHLGRCDFVVSTGDDGSKTINLFFRFKGLERSIPKLCHSGIKSRLYEHRRWEIHGLDGARGPQPPSYYEALQKREEKRWLEDQYAVLAELKAERDKWEECRDKDGYLFYRLRENGFVSYNEPDEYKEVKSQEEVLGLREEEEKKRILARKIRLKEERDRIAAEREAKFRAAHPEWYKEVPKTRELGEQDLFVLNEKQEAALAAKEARERELKEKADREDPDQAVGDPMGWGHRAVAKWMGSSKVLMYAPVFRQAEVTGAQLVAMKEPEMEEIGVANHVHRVIIMRLAKKLQGEWQQHLANIQAEHVGIIDTAKDIVRTLAEMALRYRTSQARVAKAQAEQSTDDSAEAIDKSAEVSDKLTDKSAEASDKLTDKSAEDSDKSINKSAETSDKLTGKTTDADDEAAEGDDKSSADEDQLDYHSFAPVVKRLREVVDQEGAFRVKAEFEGVKPGDIAPPVMETLSGLDSYKLAMTLFNELESAYEAEQKRLQEQDRQERLCRDAQSRLHKALNGIYKNATEDAKDLKSNYYRHLNLLEVLKKALMVKLVTDDLAVVQEARMQLQDFSPRSEDENLQLPPKKTLSIEGWGWVSAQWMDRVGQHLFKTVKIEGEPEPTQSSAAFPSLDNESLPDSPKNPSPKGEVMKVVRRRQTLLMRHAAMRMAAAEAAKAFVLNDESLSMDSEDSGEESDSPPLLSDDHTWIKKIKKLFNKIDKDGNGVLGLQEIRRFIRKTDASSVAISGKKKPSRDILTPDTSQTSVRAKMRAQQKEKQAKKARLQEREESSRAFLELFDANKDGKVTLAEFIRVFDLADIEYAQTCITDGLRQFKEQHDAKKKKRKQPRIPSSGRRPRIPSSGRRR